MYLFGRFVTYCVAVTMVAPAWAGPAVGQVDEARLMLGPGGLVLINSGTGEQFPRVAREGPEIGPLSLAPGGGLLAAVQPGCDLIVERKQHPGPGQNGTGVPEENLGRASVWRLDLTDREFYGAPDSTGAVPLIGSPTPFSEVVGMAASADSVWLATDSGLLRVDGWDARAFRPSWSSPLISAFTGSRGWSRLRGVGVDATGRVWVAAAGIPSVFAFEAGKSESETRVEVVRGLLPMALAASAGAPGAWLVVKADDGIPAAVHVTAPHEPGAPTPAAGRPSVTATVRSLLARAPRLRLVRMRIRADSEGALWVAGDDEQGVRIYRCRGETAVEQHGFETLLHGGRITDIADSGEGKVLFATDTAGVLVYDAGQWRPHPINDRLPRLAPTSLRSVHGVLPLPDGGLCVTVGKHLLIWRPS